MHGLWVQDLARLVDKGVADAQQKLAAAQRLAKLETEPDHYAVLGVQNTATPADIKQAFRLIHTSEVPPQYVPREHQEKFAKSRMVHPLILHIMLFKVCLCKCRQLALKYHPDKAGNPGQRAASDKLFKLISNAHSVLANRDQRRLFDLTMLRRQMHAKGRHAT